MTSGTDTGAREGDERDVTALVVLRAASGRVLRPDEAPSTANLDRLLPADDDVSAVVDGLLQRGFVVGPLLGNSMSITASVRHVEQAFGVRLVGDEGAWTITSADGSTQPMDDDIELPIESLGVDLAPRVERIVIEPPADLHEESTWTP